jgi:hypothetical protein
MTLETLDGLLDRFEELRSREVVRFHNGFRTWKMSYRQLSGHIGGFQRQPEEAGLGLGGKATVNRRPLFESVEPDQQEA